MGDFGDGETECPETQVPINDLQLCKDAARAFGYSFGGEWTGGHLVTEGCFRWLPNDAVYLNINVESKSASQSSLICESGACCGKVCVTVCVWRAGGGGY